MKPWKRHTPETAAERPPDPLATRYTEVIRDRLARDGTDATEDGLRMFRSAYFKGRTPSELMAISDQEDGLHLTIISIASENACHTVESPRGYCLGLNEAVLMYTSAGMGTPDGRLLTKDLDHLMSAPLANPKTLQLLRAV